MLDTWPMRQFARWLDDAVASGMPEPTAMVLTTAGERPHARTVLRRERAIARERVITADEHAREAGERLEVHALERALLQAFPE